MPSEIENQPSLVSFEVFVQAAFEREFFRRQLLQCEVALRHSVELVDSLKKCLEFCDVGLPARSLEASLSEKHRAAISACTQTLVEYCDDIIRKSHSELLMQCTAAAISDASDQSHTRALALAAAVEARDLSRSIESESLKGELTASQQMVSVLRRRVDALEHLLEQERQQIHTRTILQAEECASQLLSQHQALHDAASLRMDSLASQVNRNETRLARLRSSLRSSLEHCDRVQKGSDRSILHVSLYFIFYVAVNTSPSACRQLESAELELSELRLKHENSLATLRECEANIAEKDEMIRLLDKQCALYESLLPANAVDKARTVQHASKAGKHARKTTRAPSAKGN